MCIFFLAVLFHLSNDFEIHPFKGVKATKIPLNGCIIILGCFQLLVVINKAPTDTHVKVYIFDLFVSHRPMAGLEWLHHVAGVCEIHILRND